MMCHRLCLVLLAVASGMRGRLEEQRDPELSFSPPRENRLKERLRNLGKTPLQKLQRKARSTKVGDRDDAAKSPELAKLVAANRSQAVEILQKLAKDKNWGVMKEVARSQALKALVKVRTEEATQVIKDLAKDDNVHVRAAVAWSPALEVFVKTKPEQGFQVAMDLLESSSWIWTLTEQNELAWWPLFEKYATPLADSLEGTLEQARPQERVSLVTSSNWRPFMHLNFEKGKNVFARLIQDPDPALRRAAVDAPAWSVVFSRNVAEGLSLFKTLSRSLARDAEATAAKEKEERHKAQEAADKAKQAELKAHTAAQEAQEAQQQAENERTKAEEAQQRAEAEKTKAVQAKKDSDDQRQKAEAAQAETEAAMNKAKILLLLVLVFGALALFFATLFWSYPFFVTWREERRIVGQAKEFLSEAETFQIVASLESIPTPLADLTIFKRPDVFNNPYILYRYNCLEPALREAFRLGALHMKHGLELWDFSQVIKSSGAASQELATRNYSMAREFLDKNESAQMSKLMLTCGDIQGNCDPYSSDLESIPDAVEACYQMYRQAFVAKRAYFDAMVKRIGQTTGAEARFCGEKGLLRLAEKHCLRPNSGLIWDGIRAMLVGKSLDQLREALGGLKAEQDAGRIKIVHINNRFARPTKDNWQDIAVYVMFNDSRFSGIVGEIQLVHETFLAVRTHFKAHDAYDGIRFAAEALKLKNQVEVRGLPDSQRSNSAP